MTSTPLFLSPVFSNSVTIIYIAQNNGRSSFESDAVKVIADILRIIFLLSNLTFKLKLPITFADCY